MEQPITLNTSPFCSSLLLPVRSHFLKAMIPPEVLPQAGDKLCTYVRLHRSLTIQTKKCQSCDKMNELLTLSLFHLIRKGFLVICIVILCYSELFSTLVVMFPTSSKGSCVLSTILLFQFHICIFVLKF